MGSRGSEGTLKAVVHTPGMGSRGSEGTLKAVVHTPGMGSRGSEGTLKAVVHTPGMGSRGSEVQTSGRAAPRGALRPPALSLMEKEQQYLRMNAELEAKTAAVVRQAEEVMRDQNYILSKPIPNNLDLDFEDASSIITPKKPFLQPAGVKAVRKKKVPPPSQTAAEERGDGEELRTARPRSAGDLGLETTLLHLEERLEGFCQEDVLEEVLEEAPPTEGSVGSEAQIRVLKAKLRIMQEELDRSSYDYSRKEDENGQLCSRIKELEQELARLQKTGNIQQTLTEKQRCLAEASGRRCDALQAQVAALHKEVEGSKRAQKQAAANHSSVEVRLNRALEEVERLKAQLSNVKQLSKDRTKEVHVSKENLLAENKVLKKQREELLLAFKKQLKLIDLLRRQKMHFEAAKMLSFTEEEFMKALDWGKA